jgi:predicted nucleotidyltransferase
MLNMSEDTNYDKMLLFPSLAQKLKNINDLQLVYIFGSYGRNNPKPLSDVDLAVLLIPGTKVYYFKRRLELIREITTILKTDKIDLVILNEAPLPLAYRVLRDGKLLYKVNEVVEYKFKEQIVLQYLDFQPILNMHLEALKKRLKEGTFGG